MSKKEYILCISKILENIDNLYVLKLIYKFVLKLYKD